MPEAEKYKSSKYQKFQHLACTDSPVRCDVGRPDVRQEPSMGGSISDSPHQMTVRALRDVEDPFYSQPIPSVVLVDEEQKAVDAQLLHGIQTSMTDDDDLTILEASALGEEARRSTLTGISVDHSCSTPDGVRLLNEYFANSVPRTDGNGAAQKERNDSSPDLIIDLTDDITPSIESDDQKITEVEMVDLLDDEEDDDCVLVTTAPVTPRFSLPLSIRSRSRTVVAQETPSRHARYPEYHTTVLK
jgi:hypothetical protein